SPTTSAPVWRQRFLVLHANDGFHAHRVEEQRLAAILRMLQPSLARQDQRGKSQQSTAAGYPSAGSPVRGVMVKDTMDCSPRKASVDRPRQRGRGQSNCPRVAATPLGGLGEIIIGIVHIDVLGLALIDVDRLQPIDFSSLTS